MSFLYSESCQQSFTIDLIDGCLHVCSYLQDIFGLGNTRYSIIHQFVTTWTGNMTISCVNMFVLIILDEVSMFLEIILKNSITYMFLQSQIKREKIFIPYLYLTVLKIHYNVNFANSGLSR